MILYRFIYNINHHCLIEQPMETLKIEEIKAPGEQNVLVFKSACIFSAKQELQAASKNMKMIESTTENWNIWKQCTTSLA